MHCGLHRALLWLLSYPWDSTWSALGHLLRRARSPLGRVSPSFLTSVSPWPSPASTFPTTTFVTCYCEHNIWWEKGWFYSSSSLYSQNLDGFWLKDGAQYMCWMTEHGQSQVLKHGHSLWQQAGASSPRSWGGPWQIASRLRVWWAPGRQLLAPCLGETRPWLIYWTIIWPPIWTAFRAHPRSLSPL